MLKPFQPFGDTLTLAVTTASTGAASNIAGNYEQMRVYNVGPNIARFRTGSGTLTATVTDTPIPVGGVELFTKGGAVSFAAICEVGTAALHITCGSGE